MGKYYLKQMIFLVLYIKEHVCVIKISFRVGFNMLDRPSDRPTSYKHT